MHEICVLNRKSPRDFEAFLTKYKGALHESNSFVLQIKYALTQLYGNVDGFALTQMTEVLLERKASLCEELLQIALIIEPGLSSFRGFLLVDLYTTKMELLKRYKSKGMLLEGEHEKRCAELAQLLKDIETVNALDSNGKKMIIM